MKYIVEHMEQGFSPWVQLEYRSISQEVGPQSIILSSISPDLEIPETIKGKCTTTHLDVLNLKEILPDFSVDRVCLLDPSADQELEPADADRFDYFLFGGILGDHPPRDRTGELRKLGFAGRNLRKVQMTTDTAVRVTQRVVDSKKTLDEIPFIDFPTLKFNRFESTEMPFRYIKDESGRPIMPDGMFELIREDNDKTLDDLL